MLGLLVGEVVVLLVWVEIWEIAVGGGEGGESLEAWEVQVFLVGLGEGHGEDEGGPPGAQVDRHVDPGVAILAVEGQASP